MKNNIVINEEQARKDLDRFYSKGEFNITFNPCYLDYVYAIDLEQRYGMTIKELAKAIGYEDH